MNSNIANPRLVSPSLGSLSVDALRIRILSGEIAAGERINEVELAEVLGISRGPLREAVRQLVGEGLLVSVQNKGAFVKEFSERELTNLYQLRIAVESHSLRILTSAVDLQPVVDSLALTRERISASQRDYQQEFEFHDYLIQATDNPYLIRTAKDVRQQIVLAGSMLGYDLHRSGLAADEHAVILQHLQAADFDAAADAMKEHLELALARSTAKMRANIEQ